MISEIGLAGQGLSLQLTFIDGRQQQLAAALLRENAMDAVTKRERIVAGSVQVVEDIRITEINAVGSTGINIQFSDGHDRAIFPYQYLAKLATDSDK